MKKVGIIISNITNGAGTERAVSNLANILSKNGHEVLLISVVSTEGECKYHLNPRGFTNGITESLREYNLMCLYIYTLIVGHVLAYQIPIFNRIPNIFSIFYLLFSYKLMTSVSPWRKIGMVVFQFLIFIFFISSLLNANASLAGGLGIVPYQTIFSR